MFSKHHLGLNTGGMLRYIIGDDEWESLTLDDMKIDENAYVYFEISNGKNINVSSGFRHTTSPNENCLKTVITIYNGVQ